MSDEQPPPAPEKRSKLASVLRRTLVGCTLGAIVITFLWLARDSRDGSIVILSGTVLSLLALLELPRMGSLRGKGYGWTLLPAAGALFLLNWRLTRPYLDESMTPHRPELDFAELAISYLLVVLAVSAAVLELRFTVWKRPFLSLTLVAMALALSFPEGATAIQLGWPEVLVTAVASGAFLSLLLVLSRKEDGAKPFAHVGFGLWLLVPLPALVHVWWNYDLGGLVALLVLSKVGDIAGYYVGNAIGKHHPFPNLSKGKTVEGCVGSLVAGTLAGAVFVWLGHLPDFPFGLLGGCAAGLVVNLAAQAGDLLESAVKRNAGVKDSSTWFGPSGGVLDLVDSVLFTVPAALVVWPLIFT